MKKNVQRLLLAMALVLVVALAPQAAEARPFYPEDHPFGQPITVHVDGRYVATDVQPTMKNNRVYLPMRAAAEALGANVSWDNSNRCVSVQKGDTLAYFFVGSKTYYVNDTAMQSDVAPKVTNGRTMLPIRVFAEALGVDVNWDSDLLDVELYTGADVYIPQLSNSIPASLRNMVKKYYVEPVEDGIGSWCRSWSYMTQETFYEMLFVSEMKDGKKYAIEFISKDLNGDKSPDFVSAYAHTVDEYGPGFIVYDYGMNDSFYESLAKLGHTYVNQELITFAYLDNGNLACVQRDYIHPFSGEPANGEIYYAIS